MLIEILDHQGIIISQPIPVSLFNEKFSARMGDLDRAGYRLKVIWEMLPKAEHWTDNGYDHL